jgi:hypothetical protein
MGRSLALVLPTLVWTLAGCASSAAPAAPGDAAPGVGSVRGRMKPAAGAAETEAAEVNLAEAERDPSGFDFGRGPVAKRRPREAADARPADPAEAASRGIRVTWEALAVEREQIENPHFGRRPMRGVAPNLRIVLVSQDHPDAIGREQGRARTKDRDGGQMAVLATNDMQLLVRGLREAGFYRVARPTGALSSQFDDESARGRVTVEVNGESVTVLSMRGQGTNPVTKDVPRVYSEAKQAVAALRNATPTLNVLTAGKEPMQGPRPVRRGQARVLTPEEAARILGEDAPAPDGKPVTPSDDSWLGR